MTPTPWNGVKWLQGLWQAIRGLLRTRRPFYFQLERMDCGPTCLKMIAAFYGKQYALQYLRKVCHISRTGITMEGLVKGATTLGFQSLTIKLPFHSDTGNSLTGIPLPAIAFWGKNHFVVIYEIGRHHVYIADPAQGRIRISTERFISNWAHEQDGEGIVLLLQPQEAFFQQHITVEKEPHTGSFLYGYLRHYKKHLLLLGASLLLVSLIQYLFPQLTRAVIDTGINQKRLHFIYLLLGVQLLLYTCQTVLTFLQNWVVLHLSARINILLSSDFLFKLTRLPISFYDNQAFGEIIQRINDHRRLEGFLSASSVTTVFSACSLIVFGAILCHYNPFIFAIFFTGTVLYISWIFLFLNRRKRIDYELFNESSINNEMLYEFVYGMQEIKLQNSEQRRALRWTAAQEKLFRLSVRSAALTQLQDGGAFFINQFKDILITIVAATLVINGHMSLGMLLATQMMVGLLNGPVQQLVGFIRNSFDANLSLQRIMEVHGKEEENYSSGDGDAPDPGHRDLRLQNVSFRYNLLDREVLNDISFTIPKGKITAIVGASGSGKTTLVKLLLGFYQPASGEILVGNRPLTGIPAELWRSHCGAVLQDGYIFSDSIANNIAESDDVVNYEKVEDALHVANLKDFVSSLALQYNTQIGSKGNGLSQGQKQRVLIARAVYKNPDYLFFDEATNALDTKNERIIMENLDTFYQGKTVVVVAHRLSTVRNADHIIVLDEGRIAESGNHASLVEQQGIYFNLVRNQLELSK